MMRHDAYETYEGWRRLWLSDGDSNAIAALRFHGLRNALVMARGARTHSPSAADIGFVSSRRTSRPCRSRHRRGRQPGSMPAARVIGPVIAMRLNKENLHV